MTVGELSERLSYQEYIEWMAFDHIEGLQDKRADLRTGHQTMHLLSAWVDTKKVKDFHAGRFTLFYEPPPKRQKSPQEMLATFDALTSR